MTDDDRVEWQQFRAGNQAAFGRLWRRHKDRLFTYCVYVTRDRAISEDIVQETFLKLAQSREDFESEDSLARWLFICARNLSLNETRKASTRAKSTSLLSDTPAADTFDTARVIERILAALDPDERDLILLRERQGFSIGELAGMLSTSEEAVRVRLFRIRQKMHELGKRYL